MLHQYENIRVNFIVYIVSFILFSLQICSARASCPLMFLLYPEMVVHIKTFSPNQASLLKLCQVHALPTTSSVNIKHWQCQALPTPSSVDAKLHQPLAQPRTLAQPTTSRPPSPSQPSFPPHYNPVFTTSYPIPKNDLLSVKSFNITLRVRNIIQGPG